MKSVKKKGLGTRDLGRGKKGKARRIAKAPAPKGLVKRVTRPVVEAIQFVVQDVEPGKIAFEKPAAGDRRYSTEALVELGRSLAAGQLQSIGLHHTSKGVELIWGKRRLMAALEMKLRTIRARVYRGLKAEELSRLHATENLQRAEWDPVEEAVVVAEMIAVRDEAWCETAKRKWGTLSTEEQASVTRKSIELVAAALGKSATWVAERSHLSRLGGRARKLVKLGRLPLKHAIEIARLADPEERDKLAERAATDEDREQPMPLRMVRSVVEAQLQVLDPAKIPWRLELPVAGKPACSACPDNTANQAGLYDADAKKVGTCTNSACFAIKSKLINREVKKTVDKAVAETMAHQGVKKSEKAEAAVKAAVEKTPEAVNVRVVRQQTAAAMEVWKPKPTEDEKLQAAADRDRAELEAAAERAKNEAGHALRNARLERAGKLVEVLKVKCSETPGLRLALAAFMSTDVVRQLDNLCNNPEKQHRLHSKSGELTGCLQAVESPTLESLLVLEKHWPKGKDPVEAYALERCGPLMENLIAMFAKDAGLGEMPKLEDFLKVQEVAADQRG